MVGRDVMRLQRLAGNRSVLAAVSSDVGRPLPVQRHYVAGVHTTGAGKHAAHTKADADKALALSVTLKEEVEQLKAAVVGPGTSIAAASAKARLTEIGQILRSQVDMVRSVQGVNYAGPIAQAAQAAEGAAGKAETARGERQRKEITDKVRAEAPDALQAVEGFALAAARKAGQALENLRQRKAVSKAVKETATHLGEAQKAEARLSALVVEATDVPEAKALAEAHLPAAQRAVEVATRMAALAESCQVAYTRLLERNRTAKSNFEKAQAEVAAAETQLKAATEQVSYLEGFASNLAIDVADWRKDENAVPERMDDMLREADQWLQDARQASVDAARAVDDAKDRMAKVKVSEKEGVDEEVAAAEKVRSAGELEVAASEGQLANEAELRALAGGQDQLEALMAWLPDRGELKLLLTAVSPAVARRWLGAQAIGADRVRAFLTQFGAPGLTGFLTGLGDARVDPFLAELSAKRAHELAADTALGLARLQELAEAGFAPAAIDGFATEVGAAPFAGFLTDVSAAQLKQATVPASRLKLVLAAMTSADVKALVVAMGAKGAGTLLTGLDAARVAELAAPTGLGPAKLNELVLASFTVQQIDSYATEVGLAAFAAFLGLVSAKSLKDIGAEPAKLKALLADVSSASVKDLITELTAAVVAGLVAELTPAQLKGLLVELPPATLKRLGLTGAQLKDLLLQYNAAQLKALATDWGDDALKDLLTKFDAAGIKAYRTAVGADRLKTLIKDKRLKADALHHYGSAMLKTFVGADDATWNHLTGAPGISATTGQISGGHDKTRFMNYISAKVGPPPGTDRATIIPPSDAPADVYKVTYRTSAGVTGSKTLIDGLTGAKATWMDRFNSAIWEAIRKLTFTNGAYTATTPDGNWTFGGFYNGGPGVDTIFPT